MSAGGNSTIWGNKEGDCHLASGKFCGACCEYYEVAIGGREIKPEGSPCPHFSSDRGCLIHGKCYEGKKFSSCADSDPNKQVNFVAITLANDSVTAEQAKEAVKRIAHGAHQEDKLDIAMEFLNVRVCELRLHKPARRPSLRNRFY